MNNIVTDATEFTHTSLPQLSQLDTLVRCHICKDFLKIPVLTPCCHTFCSLCIRKYLTRQPKCPLCLNELRESSLRSEFLVNEIIESYKGVREALLDSLRSPNNNPDDSSLIELSGSDDDLQIVATNEKTMPKRSKIDTAEGKVSKTPTKSVNSLLNAHRDKSKTKDQLAQCPICQNFYPIQLLERSHLDECLTLQTLDNSGTRKQTPPLTITQRFLPTDLNPKIKPKRFVPGKNEVSHIDKYLSSVNTGDRRERLPKVNFTSMSLSQIKQKLSYLNLPTHGSKQNMIARYNHYGMLWNSNFCDSIEPMDESELRRQLVSWESSHNSPNGSASGCNIISTMMRRANQGNSYQKLLNDFKTDNFQRKSWLRMFSKEFRSLVEEAKSSIPKEKMGTVEVENSQADTPPGNIEKV